MDEETLSHWTRLLIHATKPNTKPRPRLSGSVWADTYRRVALGTSPEPGPWSTDRVPYLREPMDSATDRNTELVVLMCSSQVGKSEAIMNVMGYYAAQDPSPQLMLQPTLEAAEAFSKERIDPTFKATPALSSLLDNGKDGRGSGRKSSNTIRMRHYPGGYLALVGANSPAGLASRPIRVLLCDEVDRYGMTREGDPLKLAIQRTTNFANRKILMVSTPTVKGASPIEEWFQKGDQRVFMVECKDCGDRHEMKWSDVHWEKDESGGVVRGSVFMACPACGCVMRGPGRPPPGLLASGTWVPTAEPERPGIRSYRLSSLCSPWVTLESLVDEFTAAVRLRDRNGLQEFVNLKLGESWDETATKSSDWEALAGRLEDYAPDRLPEGAIVLTAGVDVQRDRLESTVFAWGEGKESWAVEHRVIWGSPDSQETWAGLTTFLSEERRRSDGVRLSVQCTLVDSGDGTTTADVYRFCRAHEQERVFACKGRGGTGVPLTTPPTRRNSEGAYLFNIGVDGAKSVLVSRLKQPPPGPGSVHFPSLPCFGDEYFRQLSAEVQERKRVGGLWKTIWQKVRERNEALDCAVYAMAAMEILHPDFSAIAGAITGGRRASAPPVRKRRPASRGVEL